MHAHEHPDAGGANTRARLVVATLVTIAFALIEFCGGFLANSLALIGDAFHNLTDALALILALGALILQKRRPTAARSYGYQRAGILASFINAAALVGFTLYIFVEAWHRFRHPESVDTAVMLWVSLLALAVNVGIAVWLHDRGRADLNVRSAVLHQVADALSSLGVIVAAILIRLTGNLVFDPVVSVAIGILILWSAWGILRESLNLLLDGTPRGIDPAEVTRSLAAESGVCGVHHLHIWALGPASPALSCHLMLGDIPLSASNVVVERVNAMLLERYGIVHTTIQPEFGVCVDERTGCESGSDSKNARVC
jgi:cobalt-zinc-cadmium efflux system protein